MKIEIEQEIKPKARPRLGKGGIYSPSSKKEKSLAMEISWKAQGKRLGDQPCVLTLRVSYKKGDLDNLLKTVCDALEKSGIIDNDSQIEEIHAYKNKHESIPNSIEIDILLQ
jgi:Holliday junction resolvase RusA-like endonuclease